MRKGWGWTLLLVLGGLLALYGLYQFVADFFWLWLLYFA
jgi:hypothetical protein